MSLSKKIEARTKVCGGSAGLENYLVRGYDYQRLLGVLKKVEDFCAFQAERRQETLAKLEVLGRAALNDDLNLLDAALQDLIVGVDEA